MKKILLLILLLPVFSNAQNLIEEIFPMQNGKIIYQAVISVDTTMTANDIYSNAREWIINIFKSSKDVIQLDDKEDNIIIGKGYIDKGHNPLVSNPKNWFTIKIEAKDGRYRYSIYDFIYEFDVHFMSANNHYNEPLEKWGDTSKVEINNPKKKEKALNQLRVYYSELDAEIKLLISSLESGIVSKKSDW